MVQWSAFVATVKDVIFRTDMECLGQLHKSDAVVWKGPVPDSALYYVSEESVKIPGYRITCACFMQRLYMFLGTNKWLLWKSGASNDRLGLCPFVFGKSLEKKKSSDVLYLLKRHLVTKSERALGENRRN
jgi:hypothetical protein